MKADLFLRFSREYTNLVLDKKGEFIYLSQNKVAQTSINRHLLSDRSIVKKDSAARYSVYRCKTWCSLKLGKSLFAFTIVRHPCDRLVSAFEYLKKIGRIPPGKCFKDFLFRSLVNKSGSWYDPHFNPQTADSPLTVTELGLDYIGYYENLSVSWKIIANRIKAPVHIPHKNKSEHTKFIHYYDLESWDFVVNLYRRDFSQLGYSTTFNCQSLSL